MVSRCPYTESPEAEQPGLPAHLTAAQTAAEPRGASGPAGIGAPQREEQHQRPRKRLEKVGNPKLRPRTSIHLSLALPLPKINTVRLVSLYHCLRMGTRRPSLSACHYTATSREGSRASGGLPGWASKQPRGGIPGAAVWLFPGEAPHPAGDGSPLEDRKDPFCL